MLAPLLTFTALVGLATLCVGCAGRADIGPKAAPPVVVSRAPPLPVTEHAAAAPSTIENRQRASDASSTASPHTATMAKPAKSASPKPVTAPSPSGNSAVKDLGAKPLNLAGLTLRLRNTKALGVFTKLSLKNEVDDLLDEFRAYHRDGATTPPAELRRRYDSLLLDVLTRIQSGDPPLAADIASSREAIWAVLIDPKKFAAI